MYSKVLELCFCETNIAAAAEGSSAPTGAGHVNQQLVLLPHHIKHGSVPWCLA
jgi:hypothetical protein